jgi:hypothetical protein
VGGMRIADAKINFDRRTSDRLHYIDLLAVVELEGRGAAVGRV